MAMLIHEDGTIDMVLPEKKKFTLEEMQKLVDGDIQIVKVRNDDGKIRSMVIDEDGKIKGKQRNSLATVFFHRMPGFIPGDHIVGKALVCEPGEGVR